MIPEPLSVVNGWEQIFHSTLESELYRFEYRRNGGSYGANIFFDELERNLRVRVTASVSRVQDGETTKLFSIEETLEGDGCKRQAAQRVEHRAKLLNTRYFPEQ